MVKHCCADMARHLGISCDKHDGPHECADRVMSYSPVFDEYGLVIHDGGSSSYKIRYCPFCGQKLPESQRDRWFDELAARGFENPSLHGDIPDTYKSDAWYRNSEGLPHA